MPQSWEFYQQPLPVMGSPLFPLMWMPGLCNDGPNGGAFDEMQLVPNSMFLAAFNQLRPATVGEMMINLIEQDRNPGAECRLGIYENASSSNNVPGALVIDAGTLTIDQTASGDMLSLSISQALSADVRYWVVLFTNALVSNARIAALPRGASFPLGAYQNPSPGRGFRFATARTIVLPNQTFGSLPNPFPTANLSILNLATRFPSPAIALAFSAVT